MEKDRIQEQEEPIVGLNRFREIWYLFLSRAFSSEVDKEFLINISEFFLSLGELEGTVLAITEESLTSGKQLLENFQDSMSQKEESEVLTELAREYATLFLGVGSTTISLCESVYRNQGGLLCQEPYFEVKKQYQQVGLEKGADFHEPDDHLSVELAYMAHLCRFIIDSAQQKDGLQLNYYLNLQEIFLNNNLNQWIPSFSEHLLNASESAFYSAVTWLLNRYLRVDVSLIEGMLEKVAIEERKGEYYYGK